MHRTWYHLPWKCSGFGSLAFFFGGGGFLLGFLDFFGFLCRYPWLIWPWVDFPSAASQRQGERPARVLGRSCGTNVG